MIRFVAVYSFFEDRIIFSFCCIASFLCGFKLCFCRFKVFFCRFLFSLRILNRIFSICHLLIQRIYFCLGIIHSLLLFCNDGFMLFQFGFFLLHLFFRNSCIFLCFIQSCFCQLGFIHGSIPCLFLCLLNSFRFLLCFFLIFQVRFCFCGLCICLFFCFFKSFFRFLYSFFRLLFCFFLRF